MCQINSLESKVYELLKNIARKRNENFSGIGIVAYETGVFPKDCHCDLRPEFKLNNVWIDDDNASDLLLEYCDYSNTLHDGFCLVNEKGELTHVAQYFVPQIVRELIPNQKHGVRTYSAACGSKMKGVYFIGMVSCNNEIYLYKNGHEFIHNGEYVNYKEEKNEI